MSKKNTRIKRRKVSIIIPTYNESATIVKIIREIKQLRKIFPLEIIVIDANSPDHTAKLAEKEKVTVIKRKKKYGKGADFWMAANKSTADYIVQIDGDYQFSPKEIPLLVQALEKGADVALGWRVSHKGAPFVRTMGNFLFVSVTSILVGRKIHDVVAGFKAFKRNALLSLNLQEAHFGYEGEVVVKAARMGFTIAQVPVSYRNRTAGKSQVNPLRDGLLTIWSLVKARYMKLH